ncbi:MAG: hypothetical protein Q8L90_06080 [Bacteroidota bacterium]|nr:hypothetical protein [Bacteroidota bacterium]
MKKEVHPNNTKGEFLDDFQKEKYYKIDEALEYIEKYKSNDQLVIVEKMTDLIKLVVSEIIPSNKQFSLEQNLDNKITNALDTFRSKSLFPKISLAAITGVVTFLFLFPSQIKENPYLSHYLNFQSPIFFMTWLMLLTFTGMFWSLAYRNEERAKRNLSLLKVDSTQNKIFNDFITKNNNKLFSKDDLTQHVFLLSSGRQRELLTSVIFGSEIITLEVAQSTAELIINRAEKKNIIKKQNERGLADIYQFLG